MEPELNELVAKGEKALAAGETLVALMHFEAANRLAPVPIAQSALAFCLAKERRQYPQAIALCRQALEAEPAETRHYYHLGCIYLAAGKKSLAITAFRRGLKLRRYQPIVDELRRLGVRKPPVFSALPREHFLNRAFGRLLTSLGTR